MQQIYKCVGVIIFTDVESLHFASLFTTVAFEMYNFYSFNKIEHINVMLLNAKKRQESGNLIFASEIRGVTTGDFILRAIRFYTTGGQE